MKDKYICVRGYSGWDMGGDYFSFKKGQLLTAQLINSYTPFYMINHHWEFNEYVFNKEFKAADEMFQDKLDSLLDD